MKKIRNIFIALMSVSLVFSACEPQMLDAPEVGSAPTQADLIITINQGEDENHWIIKNESTITGIANWDFGNGVTGTGNEVIVSYPDIAVYTISLTLVTKGGVATKTIEHNQTIAAAPQLGPNLLLEGAENWTPYPGFNNTVSFDGTGAHFVYTSADGWQQAGIYQTVQVEAGKDYTVDMHVEATTGLANTWFEVYVDYEAPADGQDYNAGGKKRSVNTWDGCGNSPFNGLISEVGCGIEDGVSKNEGLFEATQSGTVYVVIRSGGESAGHYGDGVIVSNISFNELQ